MRAIIIRARLLIQGARQTLAAYQTLAKTRRVLLQLSDEQLLDIGVSRAQAQQEASKFFWQRSKNHTLLRLTDGCAPMVSHKGAL